jgi:asparagine synthase (glutamine-hydrolysing)
MIWLEGATLALGHTRLSIIDLSEGGHQPMQSADGRFTIAFNGEIYNYTELRTELQGFGYQFNTESDTEVLIAAWSRWGEAALPRLIGMFAFAIYDSDSQRLSLVRDGFGIKPLFFSQCDSRVTFASELQAILVLNEHSDEINLQRAFDYLVSGLQDDGPTTFVQGVCRVEPGHAVHFDLSSTDVLQSRCRVARWWFPAIRETSRLSFHQAAQQLRDLFLASVEFHLRSDVPVCIALSGGIDSSAIACAARVVQPKLDLHTFSFVGEDGAKSEEKWIDLVNGHTRAASHKIRIQPEALESDFDDFLTCQGEPVGSPAVYAQWRVFQEVKRLGMKVVLEGQGGDELLGGYWGYPGQFLRSCIERGDFMTAWRLCVNYRAAAPDRSDRSPLRALIGQLVPEGLYSMACRMRGLQAAPSWVRRAGLRSEGIRPRVARFKRGSDGSGRRVCEVLRESMLGHGLSHLLRYGDRNAMWFSVENRVPFLTLPLAEFMLSQPEHFLVSPRGETKTLFRAAMRGIVPDPILDRHDKIGFDSPTRAWMALPASRELRDMDTAASSLERIIDCAAVRRSIVSRLGAPAEVSWQDWRVLNLISWERRLRDGRL